MKVFSLVVNIFCVSVSLSVLVLVFGIVAMMFALLENDDCHSIASITHSCCHVVPLLPAVERFFILL